MRYLAGLAAREQRRTLSSFIEWSIEESLKQVALRGDYDEKGKDSSSIADQAENLWDVDEADRFAKLALTYPEILAHQEQILWKLVRESGYLWRGKKDRTGPWRWTIDHESLKFESLRETWEMLNHVATGEADRRHLPNWPDMPGHLFADDTPF